MAAPGTSVSIVDRAAPPVDLTDTGVLFLVGLADRGPVDEAVEVRSLSEFETVFGQRQSYSSLHDYLRVYFACGGARAIIARYVGPAADEATANISDGTGITLIITAKSPGAWGNNLAYDIDVSGSDFIIKVYESGTLVETSPTLADKAAALDWSDSSDYIVLTSGATSGDPTATASNQALSGGTDDRSNATDTHRTAALDLFDLDPYTGQPGQVQIVDATTETAHEAIASHAADADGTRKGIRRHGQINIADTTSVSTLTAAADAVTGESLRRHVEFWGSWATVDGPTTSSTITVPWSIIQAGLDAARDRVEGPSQPAAGDWGIAPAIVQALTSHWTDSDRDTLNTAGVNVARRVRGQIKAYGSRTLADPDTDPAWVGKGGVREVMRCIALLDEALEHYVHARISGSAELSQCEGQLTGILRREWLDAALYGDSESEAFDVQVALDTSTPGQVVIDTQAELKTSEAAERVTLTLSKLFITEEV